MMFTTLLLACVIGAPNPFRNEKPNLVGETVITKTIGTRFTIPDPVMPRSGALTKSEYVVVRDEGTTLWVREGRDIVPVPRDAFMTAKEAIEFLTQQINQNPQSTTHYMRRSKAYELLRDYDTAIKDYDELIKLAPTVSAYWNNRGNLWSRKKEYDKAIADYEKAVPLSTTPYISLGNLGNMYVTLRQWDKAIEYYTKSITGSPGYVRGYAGRSTVYREKRDYVKAMEDAEAAVKADPTSAYAYTARGAVHVVRKEFDKALIDYTTALELDFTMASAYLSRGSLLLQQKQFQPAMRDLDHAIRIQVGYSAAHVKRAELWQACGNAPLALADISTALADDKNSPTVHRAHAWLLATTTNDQIRNGTNAIQAAKKALELARDGSGAYYETLAAAYAEAGQFAEAIIWQKKAIEDDQYVKERDGVRQRLEGYLANKPYRE